MTVNDAGYPPPRVQRGRLLVQRQRHQIEVDSRRPPSRVVTEHNPQRPESKLGKVDPEHIRIVVVVGV
jgi:hypothetical protein